MEYLIKELLAIDRRGRDIVEEAESQRARISDAVRKRSEGIRDTVESRAEAHIERTRNAYGQTAEERLAAAQADFNHRLLSMESLYNAKRDTWIDTLVARCLDPSVRQ